MKRRSAAFSLVEVTLALGIASFALIAIFGLLPTGLQSFRQSLDQTVCSRISQHLISQAQLTDYAQLAQLTQQGPYYFNEEGTPVTQPSLGKYRGSLVIDTNTFPDASCNRESFSRVALQIFDNARPTNSAPIWAGPAHLSNLGK